MTGRTIVGSLPRRRQLEGVEAIERAIKHCEFWGTSTPIHSPPASACAYTYAWTWVPGWLPPDIREATVDELRARLAEVRP